MACEECVVFSRWNKDCVDLVTIPSKSGKVLECRSAERDERDDALSLQSQSTKKRSSWKPLPSSRPQLYDPIGRKIGEFLDFKV